MWKDALTAKKSSVLVGLLGDAFPLIRMFMASRRTRSILILIITEHFRAWVSGFVDRVTSQQSILLKNHNFGVIMDLRPELHYNGRHR